LILYEVKTSLGFLLLQNKTRVANPRQQGYKPKEKSREAALKQDLLLSHRDHC
jgi:hypothetical protein